MRRIKLSHALNLASIDACQECRDLTPKPREVQPDAWQRHPIKRLFDDRDLAASVPSEQRQASRRMVGSDRNRALLATYGKGHKLEPAVWFWEFVLYDPVQLRASTAHTRSISRGSARHRSVLIGIVSIGIRT